MLYLDLDCRFDMRRLVHLLECRFHDAESRFFDIAWEMYESGNGPTVHTSTNSVKQPTNGQVCSFYVKIEIERVPWVLILLVVLNVGSAHSF